MFLSVSICHNKPHSIKLTNDYTRNITKTQRHNVITGILRDFRTYIAPGTKTLNARRIEREDIVGITMCYFN